jgi:hypothetical protein
VVDLRKTTKAKPAAFRIPVSRTICEENPYGPVTNPKLNLYRERNGRDTGIFSRKLGMFRGPSSRKPSTYSAVLGSGRGVGVYMYNCNSQ